MLKNPIVIQLTATLYRKIIKSKFQQLGLGNKKETKENTIKCYIWLYLISRYVITYYA